MRLVALVVCLGGCRLGFDAIGGDDLLTDASSVDARPDAPANAIIVVLDPSADTYISQDMESADNRPFNFGGDDKMKVKLGEEHGLVRFDASSIPSTAVVFSADLTLVNTGPGIGLTIGVFPILEPWVEGNLQGTAGACNWTLRDSTTAWTAVGAASPGSAGPMAASFGGNTAGPVVVSLPPSLVEAWLRTPATNHGLLLMATTDDNADFGTRESSPSEWPQLAVTFIP